MNCAICGCELTPTNTTPGSVDVVRQNEPLCEGFGVGGVGGGVARAEGISDLDIMAELAGFAATFAQMTRNFLGVARNRFRSR